MWEDTPLRIYGLINGSVPLGSNKSCLIFLWSTAPHQHTWLHCDHQSFPQLGTLCISQIVQSQLVAHPSIVALILLFSRCHNFLKIISVTHFCRLSVPILAIITCQALNISLVTELYFLQLILQGTTCLNVFILL